MEQIERPEGPYFVVLHGAKKNVGDFLIRDRAEKLIKENHPDKALVSLPSWQSLDPYEALVNGAIALIIMGGPGVQEDSFPQTYPLFSNPSRLKVPLYLMGVGSYMMPFTEKSKRTFKFSKHTMDALKKCAQIGVRDQFTYDLVTSKGLDNVTMTGCPVWYNIPYFGKSFKAPTRIGKILFSFPQKHYFHQQALDLLQALKIKFPQAEIRVGFNRGLDHDQYTSNIESARFIAAAHEIRQMGLSVVDHAYALESLETQKECDLHIGYRLHSHIFFLSMRKPSIIIAEDSRSFGNYTTLDIPGVMGYENLQFANLLPYISNGKIRGALHKLLPVLNFNKDVWPEVEKILDRNLESDFSDFTTLGEKIDKHYETMKQFIVNYDQHGDH